MTEDERVARDWFRNYIRADWMYPRADTGGHLLAIERLLDRPVPPQGKDVPDEVLGRMANAIFGRAHLNNGEAMRAAIDILHTHLTAPPPAKKVEMWVLAMPNGKIVASGSQEHVTHWHQVEEYKGSRVVKLVEATDADK